MRRRPAANVLPNRGQALGRYELGEQIAVGGMGTIYRAYDRMVRREVAYKRLRSTDEATHARLTAQFQREYETLARLPHPNIVEVYDFGIDSEGPFYAMELLSGQDLTALAPLPYREACRLLRDLASALALLHARRLIHRDVSPNNVRLTSEGRAKLIDFGALLPFGRSNELVGTPSFIAPESLDDIELDQRSDLYSFGAVAYWALTRRTAIRATKIEDLLDAWSVSPLPPSVHAPAIPPALDELVLTLLARDRNARPASAADVIDRLTTIAELAPETDERRVAYSYLAHPPLSGRREILGSLEMAVESAGEGQGQSVLIEGARGLGRSALLERIALQAQISGATVLRAQGDRNVGAFGLARKLTQDALTLFPELDEILNARESFQTYAPGMLKERAVQTAVEVAERHAAVVASVQQALLEICARTTLVIIADDLHACDAESLSLLASLSEEVRGHRLALIGSTLAGAQREDAAGLGKIEASAVTFTLMPLNEGEMAELVGTIFGNVPNCRRLALWLHEQSGGNPATANDLAHMLLMRGIINYTLGIFTLPHDISENLGATDLTSAMLARLADLEPVAQRVARLLCLHDGGLTVEQLAHATEVDTREVLLALEGLSARGVVTDTSHGFAFLGSSLRTALRDSLDEDSRRRLHTKLARALLAHPDGTLDLRFAASFHLLRGGHDDEAAERVSEVIDRVSGEMAAQWVELFEAVLAVYQRQNRSKEQCLSLMIPLGLSGFWGMLSAQTRYLDPTLTLLSQVCGMTLARKLKPWVGAKLALLTGILYAAIRRRLRPERERLGTVRTMIANFISLVSTGTAAAASALDGATALRITALLDPFAVLPEDKPLALVRTFCLATAELSAGRVASGAARYEKLLPILSKPIDGFDDQLRVPVYLGCLNGRAQAEATQTLPSTLAVADELGRGDPFFAPHAECARMTYYSLRGEQQQAEVHRARAELLALRGGTSWSAVTVMVVRRLYGAALTNDAIGLLQVIAELERLAKFAPKLAVCKTLAEARLEHLRGRPERAVMLYEQVMDTDDARNLASRHFDQGLYAMALNDMGEHARAKQVCKTCLENAAVEGGVFNSLRLARAEFAFAEAGLGELNLAAELLDTLITDAEASSNPLAIGSAHRDRARLALRAHDLETFHHHYAQMELAFRSTQNPSLIRQCETLLGEAQRAGLRGARLSQSLPPSDAQDLDEKTVIESLETTTQKRTTVVRNAGS